MSRKEYVWKRIKLMLKYVAVIISWLAWYKTGDFALCWIHWLLAIWVIATLKTNWLPKLLLVLGIASNAVVVLINDGVMPVNGMPLHFIVAEPIWQTAGNSHHLLFLADQSSMHYFSIGDLVLICGLIVVVVKLIQRRMYASEA